MKKVAIVIAFILIVVCHSEVVSQSCLPDGITFTTQSQIDSFPINYPGCTEIGGHVMIAGDDITSLAGLGVITDIGEGLSIYENPSLMNLSGLENLDSIGGVLTIEFNASLESISSLHNLFYVGDDITINDNNALMSLLGLDNITSVKGDLYIRLNFSLTNLVGLDNVTSIEGGLVIYSTPLTDLSGIENLSFIGDNLTFTSNSHIQNLSELSNLISIGGSIYIAANYSMTSLVGLENITSVGGTINIQDNPVLSSLDGLDNIVSIGNSLVIHGNGSLTNLSNLSSLCSIGGGNLRISFNSSLASLSGLDNIDAKSISGLGIYTNQLLTYCEVKSVCEYLANPNGLIEIASNTTGCNSQQEVEDACMVGISELPPAESIYSFPNPFTTSTTIKYELTEPTHIQLTIYNHLGEAVEEAVSANKLPGVHTYEWSAERLSEGMYFAVLRSGDGVSVIKMIKQ